MLPLTIFLGRVLGLYCVIVALALAARRRSTVANVDALVRNPPLLLAFGALLLPLGLAIVVGHEIWSGGALPVVVTIMGWMIAAKGVMLLALPPDAIVKFYAFVRYERFFYLFMAVTLALGLFMIGLSF
jgi:hypothetical protein